MHAKRILYLDIHVIQVVPPSCICRDDTGHPKTCIFGGYPRSRVPSQSWKRAAREYAQDFFGDTGVRTKKIVAVLARALSELTGCAPGKAELFVRKCLADAGIVSVKEDAKETAAFFSRDQIAAMNEVICGYYDGEGAAIAEELCKAEQKKKSDKEKKSDKTKISDSVKKELIAAAKEKPADSQLLFGRMFASNPSLSFDAACQVADAISVDEVREEVDYFTSVGDKDILRSVYGVEEDHAGSDYVDSKYFNSGTLYRYANVNLSEGTELDATDAAEVAAQFLESFVMSMPSGKIHAHANTTLPEMVVVELRDHRPVNYSPAFLKPVRKSENADIAETAVERMLAYASRCNSGFNKTLAHWEVEPGRLPLDEVCRQVRDEINRRM